jgi:hypothetical protein
MLYFYHISSLATPLHSGSTVNFLCAKFIHLGDSHWKKTSGKLFFSSDSAPTIVFDYNIRAALTGRFGM